MVEFRYAADELAAKHRLRNHEVARFVSVTVPNLLKSRRRRSY
jgi:hypothetical protein